MKFIATALATFMLAFSFAGTADATRPVPGFKYKDECKNIPGKQPAYELVGTGPYRFDTSTKRPNDCYRWNVKRG
jgi:hypothetical protein